jgi:hypothetical protein
VAAGVGEDDDAGAEEASRLACFGGEVQESEAVLVVVLDSPEEH